MTCQECQEMSGMCWETLRYVGRCQDMVLDVKVMTSKYTSSY